MQAARLKWQADLDKLRAAAAIEKTDSVKELIEEMKSRQQETFSLLPMGRASSHDQWQNFNAHQQGHYQQQMMAYQQVGGPGAFPSAPFGQQLLSNCQEPRWQQQQAWPSIQQHRAPYQQQQQFYTSSPPSDNQSADAGRPKEMD